MELVKDNVSLGEIWYQRVGEAGGDPRFAAYSGWTNEFGGLYSGEEGAAGNLLHRKRPDLFDLATPHVTPPSPSSRPLPSSDLSAHADDAPECAVRESPPPAPPARSKKSKKSPAFTPAKLGDLMTP